MVGGGRDLNCLYFWMQPVYSVLNGSASNLQIIEFGQQPIIILIIK